VTGYVICGIEFRHEAFRLEWQPEPQPDELDAYQRWLDGNPLTPGKWPEWQAWLDRVQEMTRHVTISRVVLLNDQPSSYQQWRQWGAQWHHQAGEKILFMPHREAKRFGVPIGNWWTFERQRVMNIDGTFITGSRVGSYLAGCDLAIQHASETIPA
jgi:hypothetical protein